MLDQLVNIVEAVFLSDPVSGGIAAVVALLAGLVLHRYSGIVYVTVGGLVGYAVAQFGRRVLLENQDAGALLSRWQDHAMSMTFAEFLVYFVAFFVVISVVFVLRVLLKR
jgi:hypothetical protein